MSSDKEVIDQFNINTNMSVDELEKWLDNPQSKKAGTGVGIESGHKIVDILKKNPDKDPEKYDEEDIQHMRKVNAYDKRHLAQEGHLKETKTREELENAKSTISLKNWGHDPVKTLDADGSAEEDSGKNDSNEAEASSKQDADAAPAAITGKTDTEKEGTKRKHDDEGEQDAEGEEAEAAEEEEEEEEDKPSARKKSKTEAEDDAEYQNETEAEANESEV